MVDKAENWGGDNCKRYAAEKHSTNAANKGARRRGHAPKMGQIVCAGRDGGGVGGPNKRRMTCRSPPPVTDSFCLPPTDESTSRDNGRPVIIEFFAAAKIKGGPSFVIASFVATLPTSAPLVVFIIRWWLALVADALFRRSARPFYFNICARCLT